MGNIFEIVLTLVLQIAFQITAEVNCCHNSPELMIPLTIGSIPFIENYHRLKRRPTVAAIDDKKKKLPVVPVLPTELLEDSKAPLRFHTFFRVLTNFVILSHCFEQTHQHTLTPVEYKLRRMINKPFPTYQCIQILKTERFDDNWMWKEGEESHHPIECKSFLVIANRYHSQIMQ